MSKNEAARLYFTPGYVAERLVDAQAQIQSESKVYARERRSTDPKTDLRSVVQTVRRQFREMQENGQGLWRQTTRNSLLDSSLEEPESLQERNRLAVAFAAEMYVGIVAETAPVNIAGVTRSLHAEISQIFPAKQEQTPVAAEEAEPIEVVLPPAEAPAMARA